MKEQYNPGDRVVLPPYGVGVVQGIQTRSVNGTDFRYYQVEFPNGTSRAFVPVNAPQSVGLRPALSEAEVPEILARLRSGRVSLPGQWAARHRKVTEILASGDPYRIAALAAELRRWDEERGLPDLDRQAYVRAIKLLTDEVSEVLGVNRAEVSAMLESAWDGQPN
ncbi:MAG TPA: CarD family transcriptional regulator [Deinococcales bacterium]|nr:CarD family transcriptional regulator [Deinococcales bacterium]